MTDDEKQELLNAIKAESQSVDELEEATSLDNVKSLPAMRGEDVVSVPITLLGKPATEAAAVANAAAAKANEKASLAETATATATSAAEAADKATDEANEAAATAKKAISAMQTVMTEYGSTTGTALKGATARFVEFVDGKTISGTASDGATGTVVYDTTAKKFALKVSNLADAGEAELQTLSADDLEVADICTYYSDWDGADMYMNTGRTAILKNKAYLYGDVLYVWSDEENSLVEISGSGGGNTYNVTEQVSLESGYYTLATAIAAVDEKQRSKGRCITYETAQGKWETKQFIGTSLSSWEQEASWEDFGGAGTVKSITVNGTAQTPDSTGNVNITLKETEVDESLDAGSTNPVQNAVVTSKLNEVEASTVFGMTAELSEDETSVRLALTNKSGSEITAVDIPAGSGGSGGDTQTTKIVLTASVGNSTIKEGGAARLTYY